MRGLKVVILELCTLLGDITRTVTGENSLWLKGSDCGWNGREGTGWLSFSRFLFPRLHQESLFTVYFE